MNAPLHFLAQPTLHHLFPGAFVHGNANLSKLRVQFPTNLLPAYLYERGQVGEGNGLAAVLVGSNLRDDLRGDIAGGGKAVGLFDERARDDRAVLQHILQVHQITVVHVLGVVVHVMEVDEPLFMGLHDVLRQQQALGQIPGNLARHVVALGGVDHRVLVGVFLFGFFICAVDQAENPVIRGVALAHQGAGVPVCDVALGKRKSAVRHKLVLHAVLYLFHTRGAIQQAAVFRHLIGNRLDLCVTDLVGHVHLGICPGDGGEYLPAVKRHLTAVSLDDLHTSFPFTF